MLNSYITNSLSRTDGLTTFRLAENRILVVKNRKKITENIIRETRIFLDNLFLFFSPFFVYCFASENYCLQNRNKARKQRKKLDLFDDCSIFSQQDSLILPFAKKFWKYSTFVNSHQVCISCKYLINIYQACYLSVHILVIYAVHFTVHTLEDNLHKPPLICVNMKPFMRFFIFANDDLNQHPSWCWCLFPAVLICSPPTYLTPTDKVLQPQV